MQNGKELIPHLTRGVLLAGIFLISATLNADALDTITLSNGDCGENGTIVDGYVGTTFHNDYGPPVTPSGQAIQLAIGNLVDPGEVIAFTNNRPPTLKTPAGWTTNPNDNVSFSFEPKYSIPVKVWIVHGDYNSQKSRAELARDRTNQIWRDERQGIELDTALFNITNETMTSNAAHFLAFDCTKANEFNPTTNIQGLIGFHPGMINIYFVNTVSWPASSPTTTRGVYCGTSGIIAIGSAGSLELLAHELGHAFALEHVGLLGFPTTNVMHEASMIRHYLTEGQTFRAVVNGYSKINDINFYNKRPGLVTRFDCALNTNGCPPLQTRLWPDTTYTYASCPSSDNIPPSAPTGLSIQ